MAAPLPWDDFDPKGFGWRREFSYGGVCSPTVYSLFPAGEAGARGKASRVSLNCRSKCWLRRRINGTAVVLHPRMSPIAEEEVAYLGM